LVEKESYLFELARYVVLNPVRAGMVGHPEEWRWSSYRAMAGMAGVPAWLETDELLAVFGGDRQQAISWYRRFVAQGLGSHGPWSGLKNQVYLGSEVFVSRMQALIAPTRSLWEVPRKQRRAVAKPLEHFAERYPNRDEAIAAAYRTGAYTMQAIADYFGIGRMTVSRAVKRLDFSALDDGKW